MTLYLIGLGIYSEPALSKEVLESLGEMDKIYLEGYTSPLGKELDGLSRYLNIDHVEMLRRRDIEDDMEKILNEAENLKIAILVPGDPLIATTHTILIMEARRRGIETRVYHSSSALCTAIGESGLHTYKFGASATIMRREVASSKRAYDVLIDNKDRGLHTLFFLEYDVENNYIMSPKEALEILLSYDDGRLNGDELVIVLCGLGREDECKYAATINEILSTEDYIGGKPCILIIPGKLHFTEKDYIDNVLRR